MESQPVPTSPASSMPGQPVAARGRGEYAVYASAILLLSAVVYLPAIRGKFIWDDLTIVAGDGIGKSRTVAECFTRPFLFHYYRPITSVSFLLDARIWGANPFGYHVTNIVLHVLTTLALLCALRSAFHSRRIALAGAFFFAVQPAQVSVVAWIGGRTDALCALFTAIFSWAIIEAARGEGRRRMVLLAGATASALLATMAKEQTLPLLLLIPLAFRLFARAEGIRGTTLVMSLLPFVTISPGFIAAWARYGHPIRPPWHPIQQLPRVGQTIIYYLMLLVSPTPRLMHTLTLNFMRAWGAGGILLGYCVLISAVVLFLRWVRTDPAAAWFLAQGLLLLAPVSNIVPTVTQTVAPYRAGCSGLAASALTGWAAVTVGRWAWRAGRRSRSRWLFVLAPAFGIWCVGLVVWGAGRWRDALTVSSTVECYDRDSTFGAIEMAAALIDAGRLEPALARLDRLAARAVAPTAEEAKQTANLAWTDRAYLSDWLAELYGRAGLLLVQRGEQIHAYGVLREGAALSPNNLYVNIGLANYSVAVRDLSAAGSYLRMVLQSHPEMTEKRIVLGRILGAQGRWAEAAEEFQTALLHEPTQPRAYILSANALLRIGQRGRARAILDSGIRRSVLDAAKVNAWLAQDGAGR